MTLLVLTYHRARAGADGNPPELLDAHFRLIRAQYPTVLPGDPIPKDPIAVCLCFDGGFCDFYTTVFPLLQTHGLKALVAIAPGVILDHTTIPTADRLALSSEAAYARPTDAGFCTWRELEELTATNLIRVAAHGYTHRRIDGVDADLQTEVHVPRTLLSTRLGCEVDSFVFPFGQVSRRALLEAKAAYQYVFADGEAANSRWDSRLLHRINADAMRTPEGPFDAGRILGYQAKALLSGLARA